MLSFLVIGTNSSLLNSRPTHNTTLLDSLNYSSQVWSSLSSRCLPKTWWLLVRFSDAALHIVEVGLPGWVHAVRVLLPLVVHHVDVDSRGAIGEVVQLRLPQGESWPECSQVVVVEELLATERCSPTELLR